MENETITTLDPVPPEPKPSPETPFLTEQSRAKASKEIHQKANRVKTAAMGHIDSENASSSFVPAPEPRFKTYYSDHVNPMQRSKAFWPWWNSLTDIVKQNCICYVYREWPVLVQEAPGDNPNYIDKISGAEPIHDDQDLNDKYGAGDFKLYFNQEVPPKVAQVQKLVQRTLATLYIRGSRDLKSRPPADKRISDINQVEMTDPQNRAYVEFLRMRGFLPEQQDVKLKEAQVATVTAIEKLTDGYEKMTEKVVNMAEKNAEKSTKDSGVVQKAMEGAIEVMRQGMSAANEMTKTAVDRSNEIIADARDKASAVISEVAGQQSRGMDAAQLFEFAEKLTAPLREEVRELRASNERLQTARMESIEKRLEDRAATASAGPFATLKEGVAAIKEFVDVADEIRGGKDKEPLEEVAGAATRMGGPAWMRYLPDIATIVSTARDIFFSQRGPGQPGMGMGQVSQQPSSTVPMGNAQPAQAPRPGPVALPAPQAPQPVPQPQPQSGLPAEVVHLLNTIHGPLINFLSDEASGEDFADWFVGGFGLAAFRNVVVFGEEQLLTALYMYPPVEQSLRIFTRDKVKKFVKEFVEFKVDQNGDDDDDSKSKGA